jgi:hypothetical protein
MRNDCGDSYSVVDLGASYTLNAFEFLCLLTIFNTEYTETNLVPMPKGNLLFECNITLDRQSQSKLKVHDNRQTFLFSVHVFQIKYSRN